jgi:ribonucleoside-triphosphate reductase
MHRATFLIGMVGLNELVQIHTDQEMHQSKQAFKFGLKVIAHMKLLVERFSQRYGMHFVLEQTPAESTAYRFAKLDLKYHSPKSGYIVKGDISRGEVYYTNSTYLNNAAVLNPIERVRQEGLFHPLIEGGALTHIWLGEARPSKFSLSPQNSLLVTSAIERAGAFDLLVLTADRRISMASPESRVTSPKSQVGIKERLENSETATGTRPS